jgi:hypothetical protein
MGDYTQGQRHPEFAAKERNDCKIKERKRDEKEMADRKSDFRHMYAVAYLSITN